MEQDLNKKIEELEVKVDKILASIDKALYYFKITFWVTVVLFVLPLVGLVFAIPAFLEATTQLSGLI
jgi:hypothetical protein